METNEVDLLLESIKAKDDSFSYDEENIRSTIAHHKTSYSSIAVRILSIFGGIFAGIAFLGFLFISDIIESNVSIVIIGIILMVLSIIGDRKFENVLLDTCCITLYIIGIFLLVFGLNDLYSMQNNGTMFTCIILSVLTVCVTGNYILNLLSVLTANICLMLLLQSNYSLDAVVIAIAYAGGVLILMSFYEANIISENEKFNKMFKPVRTGYFISFALGMVYLVVAPLWNQAYGFPWVLSLYIWTGIIYLVSWIIRLFRIKKGYTKILIYSCCALILLPTLFAPFLSGCLFLLLLSFYFNYKAEMAVSIALLVYVIGQYYYNLQLSLLQKSGILFFSGLMFILLWLGFHRIMKKNGNI